MPWPIRLVESRDAVRAQFGFIPIGALYPAPWIIERMADALSPKYRTTWQAVRLPLVVMLPDGTEFCIDALAWNKDGYHGGGWTVTGTGAQITLNPSINIVGCYHGWIRDGVVTDDCEGRQFPAARGFPRDGAAP